MKSRLSDVYGYFPYHSSVENEDYQGDQGPKHHSSCVKHGSIGLAGGIGVRHTVMHDPDRTRDHFRTKAAPHWIGMACDCHLPERPERAHC